MSIKNELQSLATSLRKELKVDIVPGWEMEEAVEKVPFPSIQLTAKTGGFYRGRIHHFVGQEHSMKSTFVLQTCAMDNQPWSIFDAEGSMTEDYMESLGVDLDRILYVPVYDMSMEQFSDVSKRMSDNPIFGGTMIDSINALVPTKIDVEGIETHNIGLFAKMLNKHIKSVSGRYKKNNIAAFYLDQFRTDFGKMMGDNRMATGGKAMQYYSSMTLWLTRAKIPDNFWEYEDDTGKKIKIPKYQVNMACVKDKLNPIWGKVSIPIDEHIGFDKVADTIALVNRTKYLTKKGNTYFSGEVKLGVGKKQVAQFFADNIELFHEIRKNISDNVNLIPDFDDAVTEEE